MSRPAPQRKPAAPAAPVGVHAAAPDLSLVVPLYDEAARLEDTLRELGACLAALERDHELLLVDDGSTDATAALAAAAAERDARVRLVRLDVNRGKGAAVRAGALAARGALVVFLDADLSTDLEALPRLLAALDAGADVVFGSRRAPGAEVLERQPRGRELAGRAFSALARRLAHPEVADFTCGFKGFRREAARALFGAARVDRWAFDAELAALARAHGLGLVSVPVRWRHRGPSKVRLPSASLGAILDLVRVALRVRPRR